MHLLVGGLIRAKPGPGGPGGQGEGSGAGAWGPDAWGPDAWGRAGWACRGAEGLRQASKRISIGFYPREGRYMVVSSKQ